VDLNIFPNIFLSECKDVLREKEFSFRLADGPYPVLEIFLCEHKCSGGILLKLKPNIKKQKCFSEPPAFLFNSGSKKTKPHNLRLTPNSVQPHIC
jgi:hypothetical protein